MRHRIVRLIVVVLLLAVGAGAAVVAWDVERGAPIAVAEQREVDDRLDRLSSTLADISIGQAAYVAPGQDPGPAIERSPLLIREVSTGTAAIGPMLHAPDSRRALQSFADAISRLAEADGLARDSVFFGDTFTASNTIFGEARAALTAMSAALGTIRAVEASTRADERAAVRARGWKTVAGAAIIWTIGLLLLAPLSTRRPPQLEAPLPSDTSAETTASPEPQALYAGDVIEAADLCTAISRVESTTALTSLLARAATLLDGAGIIVWMNAGSELFAAAAHGYTAATMGRLGAIPRDATNATAAAWRTGALQVVPGDRTSHGAIAAPLFGPDACIGVFAVELRHGREADSVTRAITVMIAAQLASVVAGWPGANSETSAQVDGLGEVSGLRRGVS